jgi:hypothetical protein
MIRSIMRLAFCGSLALALANGVLAPTAGAASDWQSVKAATARFHSFKKAQAAGYTTEDEPCVALPDGGAMGIHAVDRQAASDQSIDPEQPEILLYIPKANGKLKLVGVEYFQVALVNTAEGPAPLFGEDPPENGFFTPPPSVLGQTFDGPMPGHHPAMPWHYDLHVWLWENNPDGLFAPFNPTLSCP